jgi:hypothetical protein
MSLTHFSVEVGRLSLQGPCVYLSFPSRRGWKVVIIFFFTVHAHTDDVAIRANKDADVASWGCDTWHMACACSMLA